MLTLVYDTSGTRMPVHRRIQGRTCCPTGSLLRTLSRTSIASSANRKDTTPAMTPHPVTSAAPPPPYARGRHRPWAGRNAARIRPHDGSGPTERRPENGS